MARSSPILVVALADAVRVYRPSEAGWETVSALDTPGIRALVADPRPGPPASRGAGALRVGTEDGVVLSTSRQGGPWVQEGAALDGPVRALELDARGRLLAGSEPSAVFRRGGPGDEWDSLAPLAGLPSSPSWSYPPRPETHHVRRILSDRGRPGLLHVAVEAGALVRSPDGGTTWIDRTPSSPRDTHGLVDHPARPGRLYAAAGDGYFESRDHGDSWTTPRQGLAHGYAWSVAVDRSDPDLRLLTASSGARWAHDAERASSVVYRRTSDAGWTLCMDGLGASGGTTVGTLAADPGLRGCFWIATNRGISVSTDGGRSWLAVAVDWPERFRRQRVEGFVVLR
jgi:hypothetical protein